MLFPSARQVLGACIVIFGFLPSASCPAVALERSEALAPEHTDSWNLSATCTVAYYNICNGWLWLWSNPSARDRLGVVFDSCAPPAVLASTSMYFHGAPAGYGYTGMLDVFAADGNDCPQGAPIASRAFLPFGGWNAVSWEVAVPSRFVVTYTFPYPPVWNMGPYSDHPAAGPTGASGCGTCYPSGRVGQSFLFGTVANPLCPGTPLSDGSSCEAELMWTASFLPIPAVGVEAGLEPRSWGAVKALYR